MEIGKRMMEKWGWAKGQGLGKDNNGMTSCLVLRKQEGSATQGRIERAVPLADPVVQSERKPSVVAPSATASNAAVSIGHFAAPSGNAFSVPAMATPAGSAVSAPAMVTPAASLTGSFVGQASTPADPTQTDSIAAAAAIATAQLTAQLQAEAVNNGGAAANPEPVAKRRRSKWDADPAEAEAHCFTGESSAMSGTGIPSIAPINSQGVGTATAVPTELEKAAAAASAALKVQMAGVPQVSVQSISFQQVGASQGVTRGIGQQSGLGAGNTASTDHAVYAPGASNGNAANAAGLATGNAANAAGFRMGLAMGQAMNMGMDPSYLWSNFPAFWQTRTPKQQEDWRWSKGHEALRSLEELSLPPELVDIARQVLGESSRYPARIADDTDCTVEVTAWNTLLLRPRGSGADIGVAKRMIYDVLHPGGEQLRQEVLISTDETAEAAVRDPSGITNFDTTGGGKKMYEEAVERSGGGKLRRVGLGAENDALEAQQFAARDIALATAQDVALVYSHLEDVRTASGVAPSLTGGTLKLVGKEKNVERAADLVRKLVETGEWVALAEGFVLSEETKQKRRENDGPVEQILVKVPEGQVTQTIEKHLKAMERASEAEKLKLTSKAVAGKRTLMIEGTRRAHERVKLMVTEITNKGESPMLNKALGVARAAARPTVIEPAFPQVLSPGPCVHISSSPAPGVIAAPPSLITNMVANPLVGSCGPAPANVAAPFFKPQRVAGSDCASARGDLFAGLPPPSSIAGAGVPVGTGSMVPTAVPVASEPAAVPTTGANVGVAFPPVHPALHSMQGDGGAPSALNHPASTLTVNQEMAPLDISHEAMAAAERELMEFAMSQCDAGVTE